MKKAHFNWLEENLTTVEKQFLVSTDCIPDKDRNAKGYEEFISIFDSKKEFDEAFVDFPPISDDESAFDWLVEHNTAAIFNGKYVFFDYLLFDDTYPGRKVVEE